MDAQETQRTAEPDTSGIEKIGTCCRRLFQAEIIWFVLKFFDCQDVLRPMLSLFPLRFRGSASLDAEAEGW